MATLLLDCAHDSAVTRLNFTKYQTMKSSSRQQNGGNNCRGWTIVLVAFLTDALALGGRALFAVVLLYWEKEFGWTRSYVSGSISLLHVSIALSTPISGHVVDVFGPRRGLVLGICFFSASLYVTGVISYAWQLYVFYGLLGGLSLGLLNLNVFSVAVMQALPEKHHGRAVGITTSGSTFGQLLLVPCFALLCSAIGWRNSYFVVASLTLVMAPIAWVVLGPRTNSPEKQYEPASGMMVELVDCSEVVVADAPGSVIDTNGVSQQPVKSVDSKPTNGTDTRMDWRTDMWIKTRKSFQNRYFWHLLVSFVICGITTVGFIETHIVAFSVSKGLTKEQGAFGFGLLSMFNGFGIMLSGYLSDHYSRSLLLCCIFLVRGICYIFMYVISDFPGLFVFAIFFGLTDYAVVPPVIGLVSRFIGSNAVGLAMGILLAFHSIGAAVGAAIGSHAFDQDGHYDIPLGVCSGLCFFASIMCIMIPEEFRRKKTNDKCTFNTGESQVLEEDSVRCVFDVGSGATKCHVASINRAKNQVTKSLYSHQTQIMLRHDIQSSPDGKTFSNEILQECRDCLRAYKQIASDFGCTRYNGIATAVFRHATNGKAFLDLLNEVDGLSIEVISQKEEGKVGFLSAVCVAPNISRDKIISWDSGGGSFQLTDANFNVFEGPYGSTHALTRALEQKELSFDPEGTASPFTKADLDSLIALIKSDIEDSVINNEVRMEGETKIVYDTLKSAKDIQVVCIGGDT